MKGRSSNKYMVFEKKIFVYRAKVGIFTSFILFEDKKWILGLLNGDFWKDECSLFIPFSSFVHPFRPFRPLKRPFWSAGRSNDSNGVITHAQALRAATSMLGGFSKLVWPVSGGCEGWFFEGRYIGSVLLK